MPTIKNGFNKAGMYPLNPDVIDKTHLTLDISISLHHEINEQVSLSQSPPNHSQNTIIGNYVNNDDQFTRKTAILQDKFLDLVNLV